MNSSSGIVQDPYSTPLSWVGPSEGTKMWAKSASTWKVKNQAMKEGVCVCWATQGWCHKPKSCTKLHHWPKDQRRAEQAAEWAEKSTMFDLRTKALQLGVCLDWIDPARGCSRWSCKYQHAWPEVDVPEEPVKTPEPRKTRRRKPVFKTSKFEAWQKAQEKPQDVTVEKPKWGRKVVKTQAEPPTPKVQEQAPKTVVSPPAMAARKSYAALPIVPTRHQPEPHLSSAPAISPPLSASPMQASPSVSASPCDSSSTYVPVPYVPMTHDAAMSVASTSSTEIGVASTDNLESQMRLVSIQEKEYQEFLEFKRWKAMRS